MADSRPIALISALPEETAELLRDLVADGAETVAGLIFRRGLIEGQPVILTETGIGKVNAALVTALAVERFGARAVTVSGVAGALDPELGIGDVVVATRLVQHDYGRAIDGGIETYQPGDLPFGRRRAKVGYELAPSLVEAARAVLAGLELPPVPGAGADGVERRPLVRFGAILTGDQFVASEAVRMRLFTEHGAAAVEMEGSAVAQVADAFGIPWLVVRSVSDLAGRESAVDFARFVGPAAIGAARVVRRLLPLL